MKNAVIYDRIAYKVKRKELKLRKKNLTKLTKDKGYQIKNIFIDNGYSGLNFERPNFNKMITYINNNNIDVIVVKSFSCIGRNIIDLENFIASMKELDIRIDTLD